MTGRVTMLGISWWAGKGGSYRTIQRLYTTWMVIWLPHMSFCSAPIWTCPSTSCSTFTTRVPNRVQFPWRQTVLELEDFMNVGQTPVTNAANLSLWMVNLSQLLLDPYRSHDPAFSVLNPKSHFRGYRYVSETVKMLPQNLMPIY